MVLRIMSSLGLKVQQFLSRRALNGVNADLGMLHIGPELCRNFRILHPDRLSIGYGTALNGDCFINALGTVTIGRYCHIAKGLTVYSHNHNYASEKAIPYDEEVIARAVKIGDAVWIGANVTIAPGATIGNGAVISMGSVVFGDIPEGAIVRGNPAIVVKYRDMALFTRLYSEKAFM